MNTNTTDSNKFDSSKSNNNTLISLSLLNPKLGNRDVKAGSGGVNLFQEGRFAPSTMHQDTQQNIYQKNVDQLKEPITKSSDQNQNLVNRNLQGGNRHDYDDDGPQPLKPIGVNTKPPGNEHIKKRDYDDDGDIPQPLKPIGVNTEFTGNALPVNQPEQPQKPESRSFVQDLDSESGNKKVKSDEKTKLLEETLKPIAPKEECCGSCILL